MPMVDEPAERGPLSEFRLDKAAFELLQTAHLPQDEYERREDGQEVRARDGPLQRIQTRQRREQHRQHMRQYEQQGDEEQNLTRKR